MYTTHIVVHFSTTLQSLWLSFADREPHLVHYNINKLCPWTHNRNKTSLFFCSLPLLPPGTNPFNASSPRSPTFSLDFLFLSQVNFKLGQLCAVRFGPFVPARDSLNLLQQGEDQDAKMAPKCDGYWTQLRGNFHSLQALNTLGLFSLSALLPLV